MDIKKKIFISHSSKDKAIIDAFIDKILILGLGFKTEDIAYTSREDTGVITGNDIREFIKNNISTSDYVFFMLSKNYRLSEICLNEMGAAWALNRIVKPLIFPDVDYDSIGWLYEVKKAARISNEESLDSLFDEMKESYGLQTKSSVWDRHKNEFIGILDSLIDNSEREALIEEKGGCFRKDDELGYLDYKEKFDWYFDLFNKNLTTVTGALVNNRKNIERKTLQLTRLGKAPRLQTGLVRGVMVSIAKDMDILKDVYDKQAPLIRSNFDGLVNNGIYLKGVSDVAEEENDELMKLIHAAIETKMSNVRLKSSVKNLGSYEKNLIMARNALVKSIDNMIVALDYCVSRANELLTKWAEKK